MSKVAQLYANDAVWARFYRDGKNLGEICEEFGCGVYDLSPWLTKPLVESMMQTVSSVSPAKQAEEQTR